MKLRTGVLFFIACLLFVPGVTKAGPKGDVQYWVTTADRSALLSAQPTPLHFSKFKSGVPTIDVDERQKFQSIAGFGFALTGGSAQLLMHMGLTQREALLHEIFTTKGNDIGVSYLRVTIGSSDMNDHVYTYDDLPAGETDAGLKQFSLAPDRAEVIPVLKEILAIDPKIQILGSPWSAPAWMKTNDNSKGGSLKPEYYKTYAKYFVKYIEQMHAAGIPIAAITVQNEPLNPKNTPSMLMFAKEQDVFIEKYLGPAFQKAGIQTKILLYDHNADVPSYALSILKDPEASKYVDGSAFHLYGGEVDALTQVHDAYPDKNIYLTEQSVTDRPNASTMGIAEPVSRVLIGATRNWSRNVLLWNLAADSHAGPHTDNGGCTMCWGAITIEGNQATFNVAYYAVAHFSKFVPPGSVRVGSNNLDQLANVAFLTPTGKMVLVVSNTGNFPMTFQVRYRNKTIVVSLNDGSVGTYIW